MSQISKTSIINIDNYNSNYQDTFITIFIKYMTIINEYFKQYLENIFIQNPQYYIYILNRGISTLNHVFKILLIYTKNLDIVYYNCQKSYIYYIEFIQQIGDDNHSFLQLNSKDASLFVYKKTIFDINNDIRKNFVNDKQSIQISYDIDLFIKIYNNILDKLIENYKIINIIKYINTDLYCIMQKIIKIHIDQTDLEKTSKINGILLFSNYFNHENIIEYLDIFIKKIRKKNNISFEKLKQYLIDDDLYKDISPIKYINNLITHIGGDPLTPQTTLQ